MKPKLFFYFITTLSIGWILYALTTIMYLTCENIIFYLIPHLILLILFFSVLWLYYKTIKFTSEQDSKDKDLNRKIRWEEEQFNIYKQKKVLNSETGQTILKDSDEKNNPNTLETDE